MVVMQMTTKGGGEGGLRPGADAVSGVRLRGRSIAQVWEARVGGLPAVRLRGIPALQGVRVHCVARLNGASGKGGGRMQGSCGTTVASNLKGGTPRPDGLPHMLREKNRGGGGDIYRCWAGDPETWRT